MVCARKKFFVENKKVHKIPISSSCAVIYENQELYNSDTEAVEHADERCDKCFPDFGSKIRITLANQVARAVKEGIPVRLLLDEMYTGLKQHFEILGYEVETIQNTDLKGAEARRVVEYTRLNDLLLVTSNQKAAELAEIIGVKYVLVSTNVMVARWVDSELRAHGVS